MISMKGFISPSHFVHFAMKASALTAISVAGSFYVTFTHTAAASTSTSTPESSITPPPQLVNLPKLPICPNHSDWLKWSNLYYYF